MSDSTITVEPSSQPDRQAGRSARHAQGSRPQQDRAARELEDTPAIRGMIAKVAHLVRVVDGQ